MADDANQVKPGKFHRRNQLLVVAAVAVGIVAGSLIPTPSAASSLPFHVLVGLCVGALVFSLVTLVHTLPMDADRTKHTLTGVDGGRTEVDLIVLIAAFAALGAIAFMLTGGGKKSSSETAIEGVLTIVAVAAAWLSVQTAYMMRYAKHYYNVEPGCIDFNQDEDPQFSDFAYVAFDLGQTYQVSDTSLKTSKVRKIVFWHTLLSYVFGTCIIASAINLVSGLASGG